MLLRPVSRVAASEFRAPRLGGEPRVVTGLTRRWPALGWTPESLKEAAGGAEVTVRERRGAPRNFGQSPDTGSISFGELLDWVLGIAKEYEWVEGQSLPAQEVVRAVEEGGFEASYSLNVPLASLSPRLLADAPPPAWYSVGPSTTVFWCGVFGSSSGLHFDLLPNCNVQVHGRKHFVLFPPDQTAFLYRFADPAAHCAFDPTNPDFARHPLAKGARGWECSLSAGEALYIPVGWYHQVTVTSAWALNVNFWWPRPFPQGLLARSVWPQLTTRARRALREKMRHARRSVFGGDRPGT